MTLEKNPTWAPKNEQPQIEDVKLLQRPQEFSLEMLHQDVLTTPPARTGLNSLQAEQNPSLLAVLEGRTVSHKPGSTWQEHNPL